MHGEVKGVGDSADEKKPVADKPEVKTEAEVKEPEKPQQEVNVADLIDLNDDDGKEEPEDEKLTKSVYVDPLEFKPKDVEVKPSPDFQKPPVDMVAANNEEIAGHKGVPGGVKFIIFLVIVYALSVVVTNALNPDAANGFLFFSLVGLIALSAALFTLNNLVRNLCIVFAGISIIFNMTGIINIVNQERTKEAGIQEYRDELEKYNSLRGLTATEKSQIATLEKKIEEESAANTSVTARAAYLPYAARVGICLFIAIYLLMPGVRRRFTATDVDS